MAPFHKRLADPSPALTVGLSEYALAFDALAIRPKDLTGGEACESGRESGLDAAARCVIEEAPERVQVRAGFRMIAETSVLIEGRVMRLDGMAFDVGDVVKPFLEGASSVALFVSTTGACFDVWAREEEENGAPKPYLDMLHALGRRIAERAADWAELRIAEVARVAGCRITNRYYPGSCGWRSADREKLFRLMPPRFCGIQSLSAAASSPCYSVIGLVGVGRDVRKRPYPCEGCTLEGCLKRMGWAA